MNTNCSRLEGPRELVCGTYATADSPPPSPPLTPPPLNHEGSPYSRAPLPPVYEHGEHDYCHLMPVSIHPILRFSFIKPSINFDLLHHPSTITTILSEHRALPHHTLSEPATNPPLHCISIASPHLLWSITVLPSSRKRNSYVTVSDVLVTMHQTFGMGTTWEEYTSLPSDETICRVNAAYGRRIAAIPDGRAQTSEKLMGVKRIDFLMGRTRFMGLSRMGRLPDVFVLNVS